MARSGKRETPTPPLIYVMHRMRGPAQSTRAKVIFRRIHDSGPIRNYFADDIEIDQVLCTMDCSLLTIDRVIGIQVESHFGGRLQYKCKNEALSESILILLTY